MEDSLEHFIKLTRNTKEGLRNEVQVPKVSKQETIAAHKKAECESRAAKIIEFLIEGKLRPDVFLRCLKHINQAHYQDVIEERAISKICGYSLCGNQLPVMPSKQFFINTKSNKVYDITERKNYCCNYCYCASLHIKLQIDDSPLWLRKIDESPKFNLLPTTERVRPGEEINQGIAKPVKEQSFTSISSFAELSLEDMGNNEIRSHKHRKSTIDKKQTLQTFDELEEYTLETNTLNDSTCINSTNTSLPSSHATNDEIKSKDMEERTLETNTQPGSASSSNISSNSTVTSAHISTNHKIKPKKCVKSKKDFKTIFDSIKKYVHEWITLETYIFLYGEEHMKIHVEENNLQQYFAKVKLAESSLAQQKRYLDICRKLHLTELIEDSFDKSILGFKMQPVPNYQKLQEENQNLKVKVRSFYSGATFDVDGIVESDNSNNDPPQTTEDNSTNSPAVLPLSDVNSQNALRRKIYLNSISKAMLGLTKGLQLPSQHILDELNQLVKTFRLQAHNVIFEPFLWSLISLILIRMLSIRDDNLKTQLNSKQSRMFIEALLSQVPNANTCLNDILDSIENVDLFLKGYFDNIN